MAAVRRKAGKLEAVETPDPPAPAVGTAPAAAPSSPPPGAAPQWVDPIERVDLLHMLEGDRRSQEREADRAHQHHETDDEAAARAVAAYIQRLAERINDGHPRAVDQPKRPAPMTSG